MPINVVELDFEQRARAVALEEFVTDDKYATCAEIIWLRDEVARLKQVETTLTRQIATLRQSLAESTKREW